MTTSEAWGSRPPHFMIIPNKKYRPNNTKTDKLPILGVINRLPTLYLNTCPPGCAAYAEYEKLGELLVPLTKTMSRRCGSSKTTPTPLNGLAMKPGKTGRKSIEGNADTIIRQTNLQKPPVHRQRGGGRVDEENELKEDTGAMTRGPSIKSLPQATIVAGGRDQKEKTNTKMERWHSP